MDVITLRKHLECPVCLEVRQGAKMFVCQIGHHICESCLDRLKLESKSCPTCKSSYGMPPTRNLTMEAQIEDCGGTIESACRNSGKGCSFRGVKDSILSHQNVCDRRTVPCPVLESCQQGGQNLQLADLMDHLRTAHDIRTGSGSRTVNVNMLPENFANCNYFPMVREVDGVQFLLRFRMIGEVFHAWVVVVGSKDVAEKYSVVTSAAGSGCEVKVTCKVHPADTTEKQILADEDVFTMDRRMIRRCRVEQPDAAKKETEPFMLVVAFDIVRKTMAEEENGGVEKEQEGGECGRENDEVQDGLERKEGLENEV